MNNDTYAERIRGLEELLVEATVNMVERRSLDGDIFKLAEDHKRLLAQNDDLRAQLLQAPNAKMVAFMAAFELWLESESKERHFVADILDTDITLGEAIQTDSILSSYCELKAQHLEKENER